MQISWREAAGSRPPRSTPAASAYTQNTVGLDVTRFFADAIEGINVAFGAESRRETYAIRAGERGSWDDYDGPGGGNAGSQGFPGFRPEDVIDKSRHAAGAYVDVETQITNRLAARCRSALRALQRFRRCADRQACIVRTRSTMDCCCADRSAAVSGRPRCSNSTSAPRSRTSYKAFRSISSSRRAAVPLRWLPESSSLRQEKSRNASLGFAYSPASNVSITLDAYVVDVRDRIVLIQGINTSDLTSPATASLRAVLEAMNVGRAQFLVNAVDTRTKGCGPDRELHHRPGRGHAELLSRSELQHQHDHRGEPNVRIARRRHRRLSVAAGALVHRRRRTEVEGDPERELRAGAVGCDVETDVLRCDHARHVLRRIRARSALSSAHVGRSEPRLRAQPRR